MSKQVPSLQTPNPFEPKKMKKNQPQTIKYCTWEVLKKRPEGLVLDDLIKEIENQGLRHFSGKKNPTQLVSAELAKQKDYFTCDREKNLWYINTDKLVDSEETEDDELIMALYKSSDKKAITMEEEKKETAPSKLKKQDEVDKEKSGDLKRENKREKSESKEKGELEESGKRGGEDESSKAIPKASPSPSPRKRTIEHSPSPRLKKKAKGTALVGLPVKVWWAGENQYFLGQISSYNQVTDRYEIEYEDGDIDKDLEIRKHEVEMKGSKIDFIRIDAHNMDDSDDTDGEQESDDGNKDEKEEDQVEVAEKEEKKSSKEAE